MCDSLFERQKQVPEGKWLSESSSFELTPKVYISLLSEDSLMLKMSLTGHDVRPSNTTSLLLTSGLPLVFQLSRLFIGPRFQNCSGSLVSVLHGTNSLMFVTWNKLCFALEQIQDFFFFKGRSVSEVIS